MKRLYANPSMAGCWWWEGTLAGFHCCSLSDINLTQISLGYRGPESLSKTQQIRLTPEDNSQLHKYGGQSVEERERVWIFYRAGASGRLTVRLATERVQLVASVLYNTHTNRWTHTSQMDSGIQTENIHRGAHTWLYCSWQQEAHTHTHRQQWTHKHQVT